VNSLISGLPGFVHIFIAVFERLGNSHFEGRLDFFLILYRLLFYPLASLIQRPKRLRQSLVAEDITI